MTYNTNLKIAFRHLSSRLKQTLVAVLSVMFGISMYVFMNSFMTGVNKTQNELAFSSLAHIRVYNDLPEKAPQITFPASERELVVVSNEKIIDDNDGIKHTLPIVRYLSEQPVVTVVTTQVNQSVTLRNGAIKTTGQLSGVDVMNENRMFGLAEMMVEGEWDDLATRSDAVILGTGLAKKLSLTIGGNLQITTTEGTSKLFKVVGLIETSLSSVDRSKAFVNINVARQLFSKNMEFCTDILANIKDYEIATEVATALAPQIRYQTESWQQANAQLEASNSLRNIIAMAVSLTILIVAGFGIYNIMNMTVNEKVKEIAILKAMGFEGSDITQIFLIQSLIIGFFGGLVGLLMGFGLALVVDGIPFQIAGLNDLPIAYAPRDYYMAFAFGMGITFLAGYLPASKASKVDPVSIIRG